jgi:hypothetical protein
MGCSGRTWNATDEPCHDIMAVLQMIVNDTYVAYRRPNTTNNNCIAYITVTYGYYINGAASASVSHTITRALTIIIHGDVHAITGERPILDMTLTSLITSHLYSLDFIVSSSSSLALATPSISHVAIHMERVIIIGGSNVAAFDGSPGRLSLTYIDKKNTNDNAVNVTLSLSHVDFYNHVLDPSRSDSSGVMMQLIGTRRVIIDHWYVLRYSGAHDVMCLGLCYNIIVCLVVRLWHRHIPVLILSS